MTYPKQVRLTIEDDELDMMVQALQLHHRSLRRARDRLSGSDTQLLLDQNETDMEVCHRAMTRWQTIQAQRDANRKKAS